MIPNEPPPYLDGENTDQNQDMDFASRLNLDISAGIKIDICASIKSVSHFTLGDESLSQGGSKT